MTYIEHLHRRRERLLAEYGSGIRPSWVSEELSFISREIAKQKEKENDANS